MTPKIAASLSYDAMGDDEIIVSFQMNLEGARLLRRALIDKSLELELRTVTKTEDMQARIKALDDATDKMVEAIQSIKDHINDQAAVDALCHNLSK